MGPAAAAAGVITDQHRDQCGDTTTHAGKVMLCSCAAEAELFLQSGWAGGTAVRSEIARVTLLCQPSLSSQTELLVVS